MGILIGIGGISRAGKSELAKYLKNNLSDVEIIHQDDFVKKEKQIPKIKGRIDWEHPDSIDWNKLKTSILKSLENNSHTILEGIFAFYNSNLETKMSLKIQLSLDKKRFLELKKNDNRWGEEPAWFIEHIWDSNQLHGTPNSQSQLLKIYNINDSDYELITRQIQNLRA